MPKAIQTKRCSKCKQIKPISKFNKHKKRGFQYYCKQCSLRNNKEWIQRNKTKHLQQRKLYKKQYHRTIRGHLLVTWLNIRQRCNNPKRPDYKYYGGRGIKVKFACFEDFFYYVAKELKADPRGLTIDRINNDGHYEKGNIRFVTHLINSRNRPQYAHHCSTSNSVAMPKSVKGSGDF